MPPRPRIALALALAALLLTPLASAQNGPGRDRDRPDGAGGRQRELGQGRPGDFGPGREGRGGRGGGGFRGRGGGGPFGFMRGMGGQFEPEFLRRDAQLITTELDLDDTQRSILDALLMDYETAFRVAAEEARESFAALRPQTPEDEAKRDERRTVIEQFRTFRRQLRDAREASDDGVPDPALVAKVEKQLETLRERMGELRPRMPEGQELAALTEQMEKLGTDWRAQRRALRDEFLGNLRAILNDVQLERWPLFERTLRRVKSLPRGRLSGESIDLHMLIRQLDLGQAAEGRLVESLELWAGELDGALKSRDAWLETERSKIYQSFFANDTDRAVSMLDEEARLRVAVRAANERAVLDIRTRLAELFGDEISAEFETSFRQRAFPRIYRKTRMQRAFETARAFEGLDEDVTVAIAAIEAAYIVELTTLNDSLRRLTRENEPREMQQRLKRIAQYRSGERRPEPGAGGRGRWGREDDPVRQGFEQRSALDKRYREQIEVLLSTEQIEQLPELRERGRGRDRGRDRERRGERDGRGRPTDG